MIGLFGGAFDPPHEGHVALLCAAREAFGLGKVIVIVAADPAHKLVETPATSRLELARAAFPGEEVVLDAHPRTVDLLRERPEWDDSIFLIGADEFCDFPSWKEPDEVLRLTQLGVATRPGYPRERLEQALAGLTRPDRVRFFDLEPQPAASRDVRARLERGDEVSGVIPPAVLEIIERDGLYGRERRYTQPA